MKGLILEIPDPGKSGAYTSLDTSPPLPKLSLPLSAHLQCKAHLSHKLPGWGCVLQNTQPAVCCKEEAVSDADPCPYSACTAEGSCHPWLSVWMDTQQGPDASACAEQIRQRENSAIPPPNAPAEVTVEEPQHSPAVEEESGILAPSSGLLQVTERRQPLSSVSSLEVHFDLLDLTELTDMSDQELAEVFADSDDENPHNEPLPGLQLPPLPRAGYLRSPSWTRSRAEREKKHLSDSELQGGLLDTFLAVERSKEN
uniref:Dysbindin domain-containing protein 1 n=1 Tax=Pyxicephalus adspersus TaxID=30357 RepID=A0AAV2ZSL4_PYXAD|nr:TPA: hypothetical protein GDO54_002429 [Pyxicephalus adspersus]